jgi:hypothetical protein
MPVRRASGFGSWIAVVLLATRAASATEVTFQSCSELANDERAQVETQLRASLLSYEGSSPRVLIACDAESVRVELATVGHPAIARARTGTARVELIVATFELALADLAALPADEQTAGTALDSPGAAPRSESTAPAPVETRARPATAQPSPPPTPGAAAARSSSATSRALRTQTAVGASAFSELWVNKPAYGFALRAERRVGAFGFGLAVARAAPFRPDPRYDVRDWYGGAGARAYLAAPATVMFALDVGLASLSVSTHPGVTPSSGTRALSPMASAAAGVLLELGRFSVLGTVGVRGFVAPRTVFVDGRRALDPGTAVPYLNASVLYSL